MKNNLQTLSQLNTLLNSKDCPSNITDFFNNFYSPDNPISQRNTEFLKIEHDGSQYDLCLPDSYIENFTERKELNSYHSQFYTTSTIYKDREEEGYAKCKFDIKSKKSLRDIQNREIFVFLISPEEKELLFVVHNLDISKKDKLIVPNHYENIDFKVTNVTLYSKNKLKM